MKQPNPVPTHGFLKMLSQAMENTAEATRASAAEMASLAQMFVVPVPPVMSEAERQMCRLLEDHVPTPVHIAAAILCRHRPAPILQTWSAARYPYVHHVVMPIGGAS